MSGVAEGIAGLALSAISVAALFTTCIDCFNIIVNARDFSTDYELLCTELSLQKLRLFLWGESVGLASRQGIPNLYNPGLDDPILKPTIVQTLRAIEFLLTETRKYDERYALKEDGPSTTRPSRGLSIFRSTFDKFRDSARRNQQQKTVPTVTRWAIFDADQFEKKISRLRGFIDGLEGVTRGLGVLERQHTLLREEIDSITDIPSLELIRDASSMRDVSDTASQRLSLLERLTIQSQVSTNETKDDSIVNQSSYHTAQSHLEPVPEARVLTEAKKKETDPLAEFQADPWGHQPPTIPQNQRIMASRLKASENYSWFQPRYSLPPEASYASKLFEHIREEDIPIIDQVLLATNHGKSNRRKRLLNELKSIRREMAESSFFSVAPIRDDMSQLRASIQGPRNSPYEGGLFWLFITIGLDYPFKPPAIKFITKVYHPNIDSRGVICLDTLSTAWSPGLTLSMTLNFIRSLLVNSGLDDPLVPEIAQTLVEDPDLYFQNAQLYTREYATGQRLCMEFDAIEQETHLEDVDLSWRLT